MVYDYPQAQHLSPPGIWVCIHVAYCHALDTETWKLDKRAQRCAFWVQQKNPKVQTGGFEHLQIVVTRQDVLFNEIDFRFFEGKIDR
jgi:hypothetical protein